MQRVRNFTMASNHEPRTQAFPLTKAGMSQTSMNTLEKLLKSTTLAIPTQHFPLRKLGKSSTSNNTLEKSGKSKMSRTYTFLSE